VQTPPPDRPHDWIAVGRRYFAYRFFLHARFGHPVRRVSVDGGFSCPNVDGTLSTGGCIYCDNLSFSPSRRFSAGKDVAHQIEEGVARLKRRHDCDHFIAYFQPATNTYAPLERLRSVFEQALTHPNVVGLVVSTRPDCVPDEVLDLLSELAQRTYVSVEYGMQTMHDRSLERICRSCTHDAFLDAHRRSAGRGFSIGAHVILGLPGESHDQMLATGRELARLNLDSVKIHNLYAVKNTVLAEQVQSGQVELMERDQFVRTVVDFLEVLPPTMVIERIGGDAPPEFLVAPKWCLNRQATLAAVEEELQRRDTRQGARFESVAG